MIISQNKKNFEFLWFFSLEWKKWFKEFQSLEFVLVEKFLQISSYEKKNHF